MMHLSRLLFPLFGYLVFVTGRPQSDPESENALTEGEGRVGIYETAEEVENINYSNLGDPQSCGYSSKDIGRVAPGVGPAMRRDYPWMAAVVRRSDQFHFCGGAVITTRHVLTAAHCLISIKKPEIFVRLGEYDFSKNDDSEVSDHDIKDIRVHDDWDSSTYENDIAILALGQRITYNVNVQPICLPMPMQDFTNTSVVIAGWGSTSHGGPMSDVLLEAAVPVWDQTLCENSFTQKIFETVQCAASYEGGKDSCQGDSGGPLQSQRDDGRWITIGIVSWGIGCGNRGKPGVYTRVSHYLDWIAPRIQDL